MVSWWFVLIALVSLRTSYGEPAGKKRSPEKLQDTDSSGTDFVPQYSGYHAVRIFLFVEVEIFFWGKSVFADSS